MSTLAYFTGETVSKLKLFMTLTVRANLIKQYCGKLLLFQGLK
jgi:hypothetical protein